jgi:hypothetical protein
MRHLFIYLVILLSFCRAGAHAGKKYYAGGSKRNLANTVLKVISHPNPGWHNGTGYLPETVVECNNAVFTPFKCESRPGTGHFSAYFLPRIPLQVAQPSTGRLLQDLHAIVKTLIFPKHIFW